MRRLFMWVFLVTLGGGLLWLAWKALPLCAASEKQVEASRRNFDRTNAQIARFVDAVLDRTRLQVRYDGGYLPLPYPNGDVPEEIGVCTDEVIRSYRKLGIDLQRLVHEDMRSRFEAYPRLWGLKAPDPNIDHRRVPNLQMFLARQGAELPVSEAAADYLPGDLVTYLYWGSRPHVAIVVPSPKKGGRPWIMHNSGFGPKMEDKLFTWRPTGHYRWHPGVIAPSSLRHSALFDRQP
jgi:uncharacterized protein YijF (DUF1287 family)